MFSKTPGRQRNPEAITHKTTTNTKKKRRPSENEDFGIPVSNGGTVRTYTYDEISKHNTPEDLWMVLHGNVYNVTPVLDSHPGGAEVLVDCGGMDATIAFDEVGHSRDSVIMLDPLFLGIVDEDGTLDSTVNGEHVVHGYARSRSRSESPSTWSYTNDGGSKDGAIKNTKTGRVENVSLGDSRYLKQLKKNKQRKKEKWISDDYLLIILGLVAVFAAVGFVLLEKRKWEE